MEIYEMQPVAEDEDVQSGKHLIFQIGSDMFGIKICFIKEIIGGMLPISKLPEAPNYVLGVINLRGRIIPVMDMRIRLGKAKQEYSDRACIVVVETPELHAGILVDRVSEVLHIQDESIVPPPDFHTGQANKLLSGIVKSGNEIKLLLNCEVLFSDDMFSFVSDTIQ